MSTQPSAPCISLNTAAAVTGRSLRTWQRRVEEGLVPRLVDERGRVLVAFDAVRPALALALNPDEVATLVLADQGDATAQAEVGALFALAALGQAQAEPANFGGGGVTSTRPATSWRALPSKVRPTPCIGWACCTLPG